MKKIILLSVLVISGIVFGQLVLAESATLSVLPTYKDSVAGSILSASVQLNPSGNQVCVVKGVLSFENLTCQSITVDSSVTTQTTPTCSNPSFTLGIPKCSSALDNLMSISAKIGSAGTGKITLSGVKVIGAGIDVPFVLQNGSYNIIAAKPIENKPAQTQPKVQQTTVQEPVVAQQKEEINPEETEVQKEEQEEIDFASKEVLDYGVAGLTSASPQNNYLWVIAIILISIVAYGAYYFWKKKKPKSS